MKVRITQRYTMLDVYELEVEGFTPEEVEAIKNGSADQNLQDNWDQAIIQALDDAEPRSTDVVDSEDDKVEFPKEG